MSLSSNQKANLKSLQPDSGQYRASAAARASAARAPPTRASTPARASCCCCCCWCAQWPCCSTLTRGSFGPCRCFCRAFRHFPLVFVAALVAPSWSFCQRFGNRPAVSWLSASSFVRVGVRSPSWSLVPGCRLNKREKLEHRLYVEKESKLN